MKFHLLIISIIIFGPLVYGQTPVPLPKPATENWQMFSPEKEELSFEVPLASAGGSIRSDVDRETKNRSYRTSINGNYYFIFSDNPKKPLQYKTVFDFAGRSADRNSQNVVFKFRDDFGFYNRILTIKTEKRIYSFQTVSEKEDSLQLDRFFAGIRINSKAPELKEIALNDDVQKALLPSEGKAESQWDTPGIGDGSESGFETGGPWTDPSKALTVPLKILSRPKPPYTENARFYNIMGEVKMRVVFLANGTVGSVTLVTKLPFGLTEEAIAAAKRIKFKPSKRDGLPRTVVKQVIYRFFIY